MNGDPSASGPLAFGCHDGLSALLGSFDGRDRRTLAAYAVIERPEQLLVSIHEQLHEELHWSTAWGATSAMAGLLGNAGRGGDELVRTAIEMNGACRQVHERFATTVSSGAVGVEHALGLMANNPVYLGYLNDGLGLGGAETRWPWQFRESAIQMLLRTLMQPAELADVAARGFERLRLSDVSAEHIRPDHRLEAVRVSAGGWWEETFTAVLEAYPGRGGDTGGRWSRDLPDEPAAMEQLKQWEETVLIPALGEAARRHLSALGFSVLARDEYLEVVEALRGSFLELGPEDWQVELFTERRLMHEEMLGAEREALLVANEPARVRLCEAGEFQACSTEFVLRGPGGPHVLATLVDRAVLHRQFKGLEEIPADGAPLLAIAGTPVAEGGAREVPLALMRPDISARALTGMFSNLPVLTLSTLRTSLHDHVRDQLLDLEEAYVLVDLPLRTQIASWIEQAGRVRVRVTDVTGPASMNLVVLQVEGLESLWMLCFRSDGGIGELAQLLDRHPGELTSDLDIPIAVVHRIGMLAAWLHSAWWSLEETGE